MTNNESITVSADSGETLGTVDLASDDQFITLSVTDEDGTASLALDIAEAEALIAKLAVKIAQARMTR